MAINKRILLGVTGGIAAYKSAEITRLLRKRGCEVRVVMTASAQQFVTPLTFQALSGHSVHTDLFDIAQEYTMGHIHLARWADAVLIAPASADMLAKMTNGLADDLLSTLYLAAQCPIYVAPAMNQAMWRHEAIQDNVSTLQRRGVRIIGPAAGEQACGEQGPGRMSEPSIICEAILDTAFSNILHGHRVLITAGPTREALDPVRFISNRSSGKMGYAIAEAARDAGAIVTLISGPVGLSSPPGIQVIKTESALDMYQSVMTHAANHDICIGAAAVADYRPVRVSNYKIKKQDAIPPIELERNPDIIASVAKLADKPFVVGFAAETDDLERYALGKLRDKNLDMVAANWVGREDGGFDSDSNALNVYWHDGQAQLPMSNKRELARQLIHLIAQRLNEKNST